MTRSSTPNLLSLRPSWVYKYMSSLFFCHILRKKRKSFFWSYFFFKLLFTTSQPSLKRNDDKKKRRIEKEKLLYIYIFMLYTARRQVHFLVECVLVPRTISLYLSLVRCANVLYNPPLWIAKEYDNIIIFYFLYFAENSTTYKWRSTRDRRSRRA